MKPAYFAIGALCLCLGFAVAAEPTTKPSSTFTSRTAAAYAANKSGARDSSAKTRQKEDLETAKRIDTAIDAEAKRGTDPAIVAAMYEGTIKPGMTEAQLDIIAPADGNRSDIVETRRGKSFRCFVWAPMNSAYVLWDVTTRDGVVEVVAQITR